MVLQFPQVAPSEVLAIVLGAFTAAELFGLSDEEESAMAEEIAVERLAQRMGKSKAGAEAQLDPEAQVRRRQL